MTASTTFAAQAWRGGWQDGLSYGGLGLPLAFVALPLYVILPNHYATAFGIPLAALGALLLGARLLDAFADPWIGAWADRWFDHSPQRVLAVAVAAAMVLALGFRGLFFPPVQGTGALLVWCGVLLAVTYLSFSVLSVLHQAWGARLGGDAPQRARIVSWREALALVGVLVASVLPSVAGLGAATISFAILLAFGVALLHRAPRPVREPQTRALSWRAPLATPAFRRLLAIYLVNGIASAVPATLVLFFIRDRLQAGAFEPLFLASYFAAGALSMPMWVRAVARFGLARTWLAGMALAIAAFVWAAALSAGDVTAYVVICVASGVALGADLTLPGAMLAGLIQRAGHGWAPRRRVLRLVELRDQAQPGAGRGRGAAAARRLRLHARRRRHRRAAGPVPGVRAAAVRPQADRRRPALAAVDPNRRGPLRMNRLNQLNRRLAVLASAALLAGCAAPTPADYATERPQLDLKTYFNGPLTAHGLFTDRSGKVVRRFTVAMTGSWTGNQGVLDERFTYSDGTVETRVWRLTDLGGGRYEGRADDVIGVARGVAAGNALNWRYTLALPVDGKVWEVQFDDWMYLVDERVMLNKAAMSKFGIALGEVTLSFTKP